MTWQEIAVAIREAFGADAPPGDFDCVKCSGGGRALNNIEYTNYKHFLNFEFFRHFFRSCEYCFIFSTDWEDLDLLSPERRKREEDLWEEYCAFRADIKAALKKKLQSGKKGKARQYSLRTTRATTFPEKISRKSSKIPMS
jgi:hypothetical protein